MKCPKCGFVQPVEGAECARCGVIFAKYALKQKRQSGAASVSATPETPHAEESEAVPKQSLLKDLFLYVKPEVHLFSFAGRFLLFIVIIGWGLKFIFTPMSSNYAGESFMHLINLPFHEAGHLIFSPFGRFMGALGGSLTQLLVPLSCLLAFLLKTRDTFGASVSLWWTGENMMDLAPYINDARELSLILLGGVTGQDVADYHDWEFILRESGLLQYDHALANTVHGMGVVLMIAAFVWGGYLLYKQFRNINFERPIPE
ncbi:MAG: zinc ribbon domain-containing protein [Nitrospiraceae bacterium]|nr:MAG: zinc ribbon domain-containing protein [Nitrospiraceae bacterium]